MPLELSRSIQPELGRSKVPVAPMGGERSWPHQYCIQPFTARMAGRSSTAAACSTMATSNGARASSGIGFKMFAETGWRESDTRFPGGRPTTGIANNLINCSALDHRHDDAASTRHPEACLQLLGAPAQSWRGEVCHRARAPEQIRQLMGTDCAMFHVHSHPFVASLPHDLGDGWVRKLHPAANASFFQSAVRHGWLRLFPFDS